MGHCNVAAELLKRIDKNKLSQGRLDVRDALAAAARKGDKALIDLLLSSQMFDPSNVGSLEFVLRRAACGGHVSLIDYLLSKCPDPTVSKCITKGHRGSRNRLLVCRIFIDAVMHGCTDLVRRCLISSAEGYQGSQGAFHDLALGIALVKAARHGYVDIVELIVSYIPDDTGSRRNFIICAVSEAANRGHLSIIQALIKNSVRLDNGAINGTHPLEAAALTGQAHVVDYLLGPDVNIRNIAKFDCVAQRALRYAAGKGYESVVRELVKADIPVTDQSTPPEQRSAMLTALIAGRMNIVSLLRQLGAQEIDPSKTRHAIEFESGKFPLAGLVANQDADRNGSFPYPSSSWNGL
jgi:hypothetical protein